MKINPLIFKEYDIRGIYPEELNKDVVYSIGLGFARYLEKTTGPIVLARDVRKSSPELFEAFSQAVLDQGRDVLDIGVSTAPLFYFSVGKSGAQTGAMLTASHNPAEYNGLKFVFQEPRAFTANDYQEVYRLSQGAEKKYSQAKIEQKSFADQYIDFLEQRLDLKRPLSMVLDASNGTAGFLLEKLLAVPKFKKDKIKRLFFEPDGSFPNHPPNPLKPEAQSFVKKEILENNYDLGCIFDGDADRIVFFDEKGELVRMDFITSLLIDHLLNKGQIALIDTRSTKGLFDMGLRKEINIERTRSGYVNIKQILRKKQADFAGELSGHYFYKEFYYSDSGLLTLVYVLNILSKSNQPFSEILKPYQKYFHSGELNFKIDNWEKVFEELKKDYDDAKQSFIDGLTAEYKDWWFNIRPSKTEPLVRMVIEADTRELLEEKKKELISRFNLEH